MSRVMPGPENAHDGGGGNGAKSECWQCKEGPRSCSKLWATWSFDEKTACPFISIRLVVFLGIVALMLVTILRTHFALPESSIVTTVEERQSFKTPLWYVGVDRDSSFCDEHFQFQFRLTLTNGTVLPSEQGWFTHHHWVVRWDGTLVLFTSFADDLNDRPHFWSPNTDKDPPLPVEIDRADLNFTYRGEVGTAYAGVIFPHTNLNWVDVEQCVKNATSIRQERRCFTDENFQNAAVVPIPPNHLNTLYVSRVEESRFFNENLNFSSWHIENVRMRPYNMPLNHSVVSISIQVSANFVTRHVQTPRPSLLQVATDALLALPTGLASATLVGMLAVWISNCSERRCCKTCCKRCCSCCCCSERGEDCTPLLDGGGVNSRQDGGSLSLHSPASDDSM